MGYSRFMNVSFVTHNVITCGYIRGCISSTYCNSSNCELNLNLKESSTIPSARNVQQGELINSSSKARGK